MTPPNPQPVVNCPPKLRRKKGQFDMFKMTPLVGGDVKPPTRISFQSPLMSGVDQKELPKSSSQQQVKEFIERQNFKKGLKEFFSK